MKNGVTVVVMSDSHGNHRDVVIPECDILIHAGDISNFNKSEHYDDFFPWFSSRPATHKVVIGGNHDYLLDSQARWVFLNQYPDIRFLDGDMVELNGLKIWGSGAQPRVFKMAFCRERNELKRVWSEVPTGMDIVVSHCPPLGVLDKNSVGESVGCDILRNALMDKPPLLNVFGHIHEAYGITSQVWSGKKCVFANCSVVDRSRTVVNEPWVFQFIDGEVLVK